MKMERARDGNDALRDEAAPGDAGENVTESLTTHEP
jgi:hypothetical protein